MANLPSIKRLLVEDFPDQQDWIGNLLQPLNQFMESVNNALNKQITFNDNVDGQVIKITVTEGAEPFKFKSTLKGTPKGVAVTNFSYLSDSPTDITEGLYPEWEYLHKTNQVSLTKVHGLVSTEKYELTLLIHGE